MVRIFDDLEKMAAELERTQSALHEAERAYEASEECCRHRGKILHKIGWHIRAIADLLSEAR